MLMRNFVLQTDNKSNVELNLKGENAKIIMSENARIKALVTVTDFGYVPEISSKNRRNCKYRYNQVRQ
jgi:hypothetical protein